jgi:AcrR family transcriptional regulator
MRVPLAAGPGPEAAQGEDSPASSTRDRILDAAETSFADRGVAGAGMREIAASVGLNPASLYNHFSSKQALYEAVLERGLQPVLDLIDALAHTDWTPASLDAETHRLVTRLGRRPHLPRLLVHEALAGGEHLARLSQDWLRPLYVRALATIRQSQTLRSDWDEEDLPLLLTAFHHLVLGYFATAPMLAEMFDDDPLSTQAIERQSRFMRKVVRRLMVAAPEDGGGDA